MIFTVGAVHEPTGLEQLPMAPPELEPLASLAPPEELAAEPELVAPELPLLLPLPPLDPDVPDPLPLALVLLELPELVAPEPPLPALLEPAPFEPPLLPDAVDPEPPPEPFEVPASVSPPQLGVDAGDPQPAQTARIAKTGAARRARAGPAWRAFAL